MRVESEDCKHCGIKMRKMWRKGFGVANVSDCEWSGAGRE